MDQEGQPGRKQFLKLDNVIFIVAEVLFELRKGVKRIYDAKRVLRFITLYYTSYYNITIPWKEKGNGKKDKKA